MFNSNILKTMECDSLIQANEHSEETQTQFVITASDITKDAKSNAGLRDGIIISDIVSGSCSRPSGKCNHYPKVSVPSTEPLSSIKMLSYDISMMKNNMQFGELGSSITDVSNKHKCSPNASARQYCSLPLPLPLPSKGMTKEVNSFLGFKSVFSFL